MANTVTPANPPAGSRTLSRDALAEVTASEDVAATPAPATPAAPSVVATPRDHFVHGAASPRGATAAAARRATGDLVHAFKPFKATVAGVSGRIVPVDISAHEVDLTLDGQSLKVSSRLTFTQHDAGMPLFNMLPSATSVEVDRKPLPAERFVRINIGPGTVTEPTVLEQPAYDQLPLSDKNGFQPGRALTERLATGQHELQTSYALSTESLKADDRDESLTIGPKGLDFFWRMDDRDKVLPGNQVRDPTFAGAYLPSNYQFDRMPLTLRLSLPAKPEQRVLTNGQLVSKVDATGQHFEVKFPPTFTASEYYFHVVPAAAVHEKTGTFTSIDGRTITVDTYVNRSAMPTKRQSEQFLGEGQRVIIDTLKEMEQLFGPYPHDTFVGHLWPQSLPQDGGLGMEYAGATESTLEVLRHEVIHSYFGRALAPANGDAGWLDEAVTNWLEYHRPTRDDYAPWAHDLGASGPLDQATNGAAYNAGQNLIEDLDVDLRVKGEPGLGVLNALRAVYTKYQSTPITNEGFVETVLASAKTPEQAAAVKATFARYGLPKR